MNIVLFGPSACGKGTQADLLVKEYGLTHITLGEVFRKNIAEGTPLGKKAAEYVNKGIWVPDEISNALLLDLFKKNKNGKGFIFDGFPRNPNQADFLDKNVKLDLAVVFDIPFEEVNRRLSERIICPKCSAIYGGSCGEPSACKCGSKLVRRVDDSDTQANKTRYEQYVNLVEPLIKRYEKILFRIPIGLGLNTKHTDTFEKIKNHIKSISK